MLDKLLIFPNGIVAAFDEHGRQIPAIQGKPWFVVLLESLEANGWDPTKASLVVMPTGDVAKPFKTEEGNWNWGIEHA